jgi:hypothetical protein
MMYHKLPSFNSLLNLCVYSTYYNILSLVCNFYIDCTLQCMFKYVNEGLREEYLLTNCVTLYK